MDEDRQDKTEPEKKDDVITYNIDAHDSIMVVKWEFKIKKQED